MKKAIMYTAILILIGGSVMLNQKTNIRSRTDRMDELTLANIEALAIFPEGGGTTIPCSKQMGEYCYFRIWDADGKYVSSNTWKDYVYTSSDPAH